MHGEARSSFATSCANSKPLRPHSKPLACSSKGHHRRIVALSESRRTESYWTRSTLTDVATDVATAEVLLHQGVFKNSYPGYPTGSD